MNTQSNDHNSLPIALSAQLSHLRASHHTAQTVLHEADHQDFLHTTNWTQNNAQKQLSSAWLSAKGRYNTEFPEMFGCMSAPPAGPGTSSHNKSYLNPGAYRNCFSFAKHSRSRSRPPHLVTYGASPQHHAQISQITGVLLIGDCGKTAQEGLCCCQLPWSMPLSSLGPMALSLHFLLQRDIFTALLPLLALYKGTRKLWCLLKK